MWSAPADSKLCFRLTKTGRFNGIPCRQTVSAFASGVGMFIIGKTTALTTEVI